MGPLLEVVLGILCLRTSAYTANLAVLQDFCDNLNYVALIGLVAMRQGRVRIRAPHRGLRRKHHLFWASSEFFTLHAWQKRWRCCAVQPH